MCGRRDGGAAAAAVVVVVGGYLDEDLVEGLDCFFELLCFY